MILWLDLTKAQVIDMTAIKLQRLNPIQSCGLNRLENCFFYGYGQVNWEHFMGYIISFMLGVFVATVGFSNVAMVIDKTVHKAQVYMIESVKSN
jgi:hypothetical protein